MNTIIVSFKDSAMQACHEIAMTTNLMKPMRFESSAMACFHSAARQRAARSGMHLQTACTVPDKPSAAALLLHDGRS